MGNNGRASEPAVQRPLDPISSGHALAGLPGEISARDLTSPPPDADGAKMRVICRLLLLTAATVLLAAAPAAAHDHYLHMHVSAYDQGAGYGCTDSWSTPGVTCHGLDEHAYGLGGTGYNVKIQWCATTYCLGSAHAGQHLPAGYSRWIHICDGRGEKGFGCGNDIVGAVRMPNGPIVVMGGVWNGHGLKHSDPSKPVESRGGPLFLHVGFHGYQLSIGGAPRHLGYVFGFRGFLQW